MKRLQRFLKEKYQVDMFIKRKKEGGILEAISQPKKTKYGVVKEEHGALWS